MIKVLVVDDHDLVRTGITRMLGDQEGIRVVGQADCGEEAVRLARNDWNRLVGMGRRVALRVRGCGGACGGVPMFA